MAPSVLWIDAVEVEMLLDSQAPSAPARSQRRTFVSESLITEPVGRLEDPTPVMTRPSPAAKEPPTRAPTPFSVRDGARLEPELDRLLEWIDQSLECNSCFITDDQGLLLASRGAFDSELTVRAGLFAAHLEESAVFAIAPLHGYCVFKTTRGHSTMSWIQRREPGNDESRPLAARFFFVVERKEALHADEVNLIRAAVSDLFQKAT